MANFNEDSKVFYNNVPPQNHAQPPTENAANSAVYEEVHDKNRLSVFGEYFYSTTRSRCSSGPWNPTVRRGISNYPPGEAGPGLSAQGFVENPWHTVQEYNTLAPNNERRHVLRKFFLHSALPYMETRLKTSNHASLEILRILPLVSCCNNDSQVNRYALHLILDVLSKAPYDSDENVQEFYLECEKRIRYSIAGDPDNPGNTVFETQTPDDQGLRVFVYSRIMIKLVALFKLGKISFAEWKGNEGVVEVLDTKKDVTPFKEKRKPRYAIACIKQASVSLKTPNKPSLSNKFLTWLHEQHQNDFDDLKAIEKRDEDIKEFVKTFRSKYKGWFEFHVVVSCLDPQIHENPKIMSVMRILVDNYSYSRKHELEHPLLNKVKLGKSWTEEALWQTGLLLGDVLQDIVMNNKDDGTRKVACGSLCLYVERLKSAKTSFEKLFVEQSLHRCCVGPSSKIIRPLIMMGVLETREEEPITPKSSMSALQSTRYRKQTSPCNFEFKCKDNRKALFKTRFRGEESIVKLLLISPVKRYDDKEPSKDYENLIKEAYGLRRLNSTPHANILRVFAYDTAAQPYHLITEYMHNSTLLQYLQSTRSDIHNMPNPSALIEMTIGIIEGLIYINEQHLVHLAITSDNVLVGVNRICKITGFQALRPMTYNKEVDAYEYQSEHDETSIRHAAPDVMTDGRHTEKSVVFSCGYLLFQNHTYGVTPYNWLQNDETERIRSHVIQGGRLPEENCIPQPIIQIMKKCQSQEPRDRPNLVTLKARLMDTNNRLENTDADTPSAELPPLSDQDRLHSQLSSCVALDNIERSKVLGFFGSPTLATDIPVLQNIRGVPQIRELVEKTKEEDMKKLRDLDHENIVKVLMICDYSGKDVALMTENSEQGNLLSLVLDKHCTSIDTVRVLVQALSALVYLHDSNILHTDISAEHLMVFYDKKQRLKVKLSRLGRSTFLKTSPLEREMPEDAITRSPPEVIKNNNYSKSSDVWQFCIMCYELYIAHGKDKGCRPEDVQPFGDIQDQQILAYLEANNRPPKPPCMPEWTYIAVKQGLLHKPEERPPFVLLHDCLTYRKPFQSCLLTRWKKFHPDLIRRDMIDVEATQPSLPTDDHVIPPEKHKSFDDLEKISSVEVFIQHSYSYEPGNSDPQPKEEEEEQEEEEEEEKEEEEKEEEEEEEEEEKEEEEVLYEEVVPREPLRPQPQRPTPATRQGIPKRAPQPLPRNMENVAMLPGNDDLCLRDTEVEHEPDNVYLPLPTPPMRRRLYTVFQNVDASGNPVMENDWPADREPQGLPWVDYNEASEQSWHSWDSLSRA